MLESSPKCKKKNSNWVNGRIKKGNLKVKNNKEGKIGKPNLWKKEESFKNGGITSN